VLGLEAGRFDEGADGGLFFGVELVEGFEVEPQSGAFGPRSSGLKSSACVLIENATRVLWARRGWAG
jgi:hypothetical protein